MTRFAAFAPFALVAQLVGTAWAGDIPAMVDASEIPFYRVIAPGLASAGQPTPEAVAKLKQMGFRTIVNLRAEKEGPADEREAVEAQGLRYVHVPVTPDSFSLADVEAVEKVLGDPSAAPLLLHCASSNRVGGVWAVILTRRGKGVDEAEAAGRQAGLRCPAMLEAVRRVLAVKP